MNEPYERKCEDIKKKMEVVRKVVCAHDMDKGYLQPDQLFEIYTGYEANPALFRDTCSYRAYLDIKNEKPQNLTEIRRNLSEWYLKDRIIPTMDHIDSLRDPFGPYSKAKYFYLLAHNGFVWKNIPGTSKAMFVEKYEKIANRLRYLIKMKEYRETGRHIIYLDYTYRPKNNYQLCLVAVSNKKGVLNRRLLIQERGVQSNNEDAQQNNAEPDVSNQYKEKMLLSGPPMLLCSTVRHAPTAFSSELDKKSPKSAYVNEWIKEILKLLDEPCVFVYEEFPLSKTDLIAPYTSKQDMKEYLDQNGIPYGRRAHRFELYELIKRYSNPKLDPFSEIITLQGHEILLSPYNFDALNFFDCFRKSLNDEEDFRFATLQNAEMCLIAAEEQTFTDDRSMEEVVDKVMTLGKYEKCVDENLTEYSEVMQYDPEYGAGTVFVD